MTINVKRKGTIIDIFDKKPKKPGLNDQNNSEVDPHIAIFMIAFGARPTWFQTVAYDRPVSEWPASIFKIVLVNYKLYNFGGVSKPEGCMIIRSHMNMGTYMFL